VIQIEKKEKGGNFLKTAGAGKGREKPEEKGIRGREKGALAQSWPKERGKKERGGEIVSDPPT